MPATQDSISHEMLYAQVCAMRETLDNHVARAQESRADIRGDIRDIQRKLEEGSGSFRVLGETVAEMRATLHAVANLQASHDTTIHGLQASDNIRKGQQGVWKSILSSRPVIWLVGAMSALAAAMFHKGDLH